MRSSTTIVSVSGDVQTLNVRNGQSSTRRTRRTSAQVLADLHREIETRVVNDLKKVAETLKAVAAMPDLFIDCEIEFFQTTVATLTEITNTLS